MNNNEEALFELSDEELEAVFKEAKAAEASPDVGMEQAESEVEDAQEEYIDGSITVDDSEEEVDGLVELDEEEIEDGSEQPDEDSDHDASEEEEVDAESDEDAAETEEDTPDGETEDEDAGATEDDEEAETETQQPQSLTFKANGQEYSFSDKEIVDQFPRIFGQAMDYTKKMQAIKPWRKTIDAIEQANLQHDDINLMIDVLKGDKEAVAEVLNRTGVDALDLDAENTNYVPKDYGRDESTLAIKDVVETISQDKEFVVTENILSKQWDEVSWGEMSKNPQLIGLLHEDVKSGMYDKISPMMNKLKVYDGGQQSDLEYYKLAAKEYFSEQERNNQLQQQQELLRQQQVEKQEAQKAEQARLAAVKAQNEKRVATQKASSKRKAAAPTKSRVGDRKVVDYLDDSDEAFEEWYKNTMDK